MTVVPVRLLGAAAVLVLAAAACKPPIHVPGADKSVALVVKLAALNDAEVNGIGSFTMSVIHDGAAERDVAVNFTSSTRALSFLEDPADLPVTGTLAVALRAADIAGNALPIGGKSNTVDLDALPVGGSAQLFALVGRLDAPTLLGVALDPVGASPVSVAVGTGILALEAPDAEWIDLAAGRHCTTADTACAFGAVPGSVALALGLDAFAPACALAGAALVIDDAGALFAFSPAGLDGGGDGAFLALPAAVTPRVGARAFATADCRVVVVGGATGGGAAIGTIDVVDVASPGPPVVTSAPGPAVDGAALVDTGDALEERVLVGGRAGSPLADSADAVLVTPTSTGADACASSDGVCNGAPASMRCVRPNARAARIDDGTDQSPTLVIGGDCAAAQAEVAIASATAPFLRFIAVDGAPAAVRIAEHAVAAFGRGRAIVVDGDTSTGGPTGALELFTLDSVDAAGAHGAFAALPSALAFPRAGHALLPIGGALVVVGGGAKPLEVLVPSP